MTPIDHNVTLSFGRWIERGRRARWPLAVAALVFAGLCTLSPLPISYALVAFALVALSILGATESEAKTTARPSVAREPASTPSIEAVLGALPDPVVALGRNGDVLALNARAVGI